MPEPRICAYKPCSREIPPERRADAIYCSDDCHHDGSRQQTKERRERAHATIRCCCKGCGTDLGELPPHRPPVYCPTCKAKRARGEPVGTFPTRIVPLQKCHYCPTNVANPKALRRVVCAECKDPAKRPVPVIRRTCTKCGTIFTLEKEPSGGKVTRCKDCGVGRHVHTTTVAQRTDRPTGAETVSEAFEAGWRSGKRSLSWLRDLLRLAVEDWKKEPSPARLSLVEQIAESFDEAARAQAKASSSPLDVRLQEQIGEEVFALLQQVEPLTETA